MNRQRVFVSGVIALTILACGPAAAERLDRGPDAEGRQGWSGQDWCGDQEWGNDREGVCEVREYTLVPGGTVTVDAAPNGGIQVRGDARGDILVLARVIATAESEARAREIAAGVHVDATAQKISASGPTGLERRENWHVSYRVAVPTQTSLSLRTNNGGIGIADVDGRVEFHTVNGGVKLSNLAGEVTGQTTNGGVDVELAGASWSGAGLDVQTTNGGVRLRIPEAYSARLELSTHNGGMHSEIPLSVQGRLSREIATNLGSGGAPVRVRTRNGGIRLIRK